MKKQKHAAAAGATDVETFGGDYHKCESTFQPRTVAARAAESKRKAPIPLKGDRKHPHTRDS